MSERRKVVIIGGGFGGLSAAQHLNSNLVDVTLIDRRNDHLFQPLLYQVATGSLSAGEIPSPLRSVLSRQKNARVLLGTVLDIDPLSRHVLLADGASFEVRQVPIPSSLDPSGRRFAGAMRVCQYESDGPAPLGLGSQRRSEPSGIPIVLLLLPAIEVPT